MTSLTILLRSPLLTEQSLDFIAACICSLVILESQHDLALCGLTGATSAATGAC